MFARAVLVVAGLSFVGFGMWGLLAPASLAQLVSFGLPTAGAVTEIRAFYGGFELGFGGFLLWASLRAPLHAGALLVLTCSVGMIGLARLAGIVVDSSGSNLMYAALAFELVVSGFALAAYRQIALPAKSVA